MLEQWQNVHHRKNLDQMLAHLPIIDRVHLEECGIDDELFKELAAIYMEQTPAIIADIKNQMNVGKTDCLRKLAHNLKGTSANLGAARMAELSRMIELSTPADSPLEVRHLITCLDKEFQETAFVMQNLKQPTDGIAA